MFFLISSGCNQLSFRDRRNTFFSLPSMWLYSLLMFKVFKNFFSLSTASAANILEQSKEIAVLQCIGFTKFKAVMIFIYENIVFVLSNDIIGTSIGFIIGYTLSLQRAIFMDLPVSFVFPVNQIALIIGASLICGIFCAAYPGAQMVKQEIADLAKL